MKLPTAAAVLVLGIASAVSGQQQPNLRSLQGKGKGNAYGKMKKPCTIVAIAELKIPGYDESSGVRGLQSGSDQNAAEEEFECELDPEDAPNGQANQVVRFNLDESKKQKMLEGLRSGDLVSGSSTYFDPDADVSSEEVVVPGNGNGNGNGKAFGWAKNGKSGQGRRLGGTNTAGVKQYLVVKVTDSAGKARSESAGKIGDDIFGTGNTENDLVNLKSQAEACSYNQLTINEGALADNVRAAPGVVEVTIGVTLEGNGRSTIRNAVTTAVQNKLGHSLPGPYSNVLYVLEGCYQDCGWAAYAYINSWNSVYQGGYYKHTGVLMHELGHNWGMAHSGGLNGAAYTDHTGLMGNPLYSDEVGKMCFNPAKNWYVGWYEDSKILFNPRTERQWAGTIVGIANYGTNPNNRPVVIKIETGTSTDQFIGFNRATGINSQNDEADNEVTIVETGNNGEGYSQSYLKAHLVQGESYTYANWAGTGEDLVVTVNEINLAANPGYADIVVQLGDQTPTTSPTSSPTRSPTASPTQGPTTSPTSSPTRSPTASPTQGPTKAPTPTTSPTSSPTRSPTASPTQGPTKAPTSSPTKAPTSSPTRSPTGTPTASPTTAPTATVMGVCQGCPIAERENTSCPMNPEGESYCCATARRELTEQNERRLCIAADGTGCSKWNQCCAGSTCRNQGGGIKRCVADSTPAPTPTPAVPCACVAAATPGPTPPPVTLEGCAKYTGGGDCNRAGGCYWDKGVCKETAAATGGAEFCSGSGGYCSGDGDCCGSSFCKGNNRCS